MQEHLRYREKYPYRPKRLEPILHTLRTFCRYAIHRRLIFDDPTEGISCRWLHVPGGFAGYQGALRQFLVRPSDILRYQLPLFAPYWEQYLEHLLRHGYAKGTLHRLNFPIYYFHRYVIRRHLGSITEITPRIIDDYIRRAGMDGRRIYQRRFGKDYVRHLRSSVNAFVTFAFRQMNQEFGKPKTITESRLIPVSLVNGYLEFCRVHRGLKEITLQNRLRYLLRFRRFLSGRRLSHLKDISILHVDAFLMHESKLMKGPGLAPVATMVRSFFEYLHLHDHIASDLARDVVSPCRFSQDRRPRYLPWSKVEQVLSSIDQSRPVGIRDHALLCLLTYHGIRPREAANLKMSDIDWAKSSFLLRHRKNGDSEAYPLFPDVQKAIEKYLPVRPSCGLSNVFLTDRAPYKPLNSSSMFSIATKYLRRCFGDSLTQYGPYVFRHSFAKALIDRGAKMEDVLTLLGHHRLDSTFVYTRIATEDLREVSDNYSALL